MDSFEFNKIAGGVLAACLGAMIIGKVSNALVHPHMPDKPHIAVPEDKPAAGGKPEAAPAKPDPIEPLLASAKVEAGQKAFKTKCETCHTVENGGPKKVGPNLFGVVGGKKGGKPGFDYSSTLVAKGGEWGVEDINEFLIKPAGYIKGTKMAFAGVGKAEERADIIKYLQSLK
ncbi:MAG: c-type cytochrome [Rhodospirillales bacterium]|nr:c-type cytochrome [Rhodospirillales bacterium]QQS11150.1 MAG: c-type cytochrome [Rhodospirillales bacterium]